MNTDKSHVVQYVSTSLLMNDQVANKICSYFKIATGPSSRVATLFLSFFNHDVSESCATKKQNCPRQKFDECVLA